MQRDSSNAAPAARRSGAALPSEQRSQLARNGHRHRAPASSLQRRRRQRQQQGGPAHALRKAVLAACTSRAAFWAAAGCASVLWGAAQLEKLLQLQDHRRHVARLEQLLDDPRSPSYGKPGSMSAHPLHWELSEAGQDCEPMPHQGPTVRVHPGSRPEAALLPGSRPDTAAQPSSRRDAAAQPGSRPEAAAPVLGDTAACSAASGGAAPYRHSAPGATVPLQSPTSGASSSSATTPAPLNRPATAASPPLPPDVSTASSPTAAVPCAQPTTCSAGGSCATSAPSRSQPSAAPLNPVNRPQSTPRPATTTSAVATLRHHLQRDLANLQHRELALYPPTPYTKPLGYAQAVRQQLGHASKTRRKLHHLHSKRCLVRRAPMGVAQVEARRNTELVPATKYRTLRPKDRATALVRQQDTKYGEVARQLEGERRQQDTGPPLRFRAKEARQWRTVPVSTPQQLVHVLADALRHKKKVFQKRRVGDQTIFTWVAG